MAITYGTGRTRRMGAGARAAARYLQMRRGAARPAARAAVPAPAPLYYGRFAARGGEAKFFDKITANAAISTTGTILDDSVNEIVQGTGESNRIARACTLTGIFFKGNMRLIPGAALTAPRNAADVIRVIIYQDKQCNGATAAVTDILETANVDAFYNLANSKRFYILMDKRVALNSPGAGLAATDTWAECHKAWKFSKLCNIPIEFSGTTGAISEIRSNNIGVMAIALNPASTAFVGYTCRVRFSDN